MVFGVKQNFIFPTALLNLVYNGYYCVAPNPIWGMLG